MGVKYHPSPLLRFILGFKGGPAEADDRDIQPKRFDNTRDSTHKYFQRFRKGVDE